MIKVAWYVVSQSSKAGQDTWLQVLRQHCADLEIGLAQEHQHRVRQEHEKVLACKTKHAFFNPRTIACNLCYVGFVWPQQNHVCHVGQDHVKSLAWEDQMCLFDQQKCAVHASLP